MRTRGWLAGFAPLAVGVVQRNTAVQDETETFSPGALRVSA